MEYIVAYDMGATIFFLLGGGRGDADPDIIHNSCLIVKTMLRNHVKISEPISG